MEQGFFAAIESGATVITANRRLARFIENSFSQNQLESGKQIWNKVDILPWANWLERFYYDLSSDISTKLLDSAQEQFVWERIIERSSYGEPLGQVTPTARLVAKAWQISHDWTISDDASFRQGNEEAEAFQEWAVLFNQFCSEKGFIDRARLPAYLTNQIESKAEMSLSGEIWLAGFDELLPSQGILFEALQSKGCSIERLQIETSQGEVTVHPCADYLTEVDSVARWARNLLEEKPDQNIAIILPDPARYRDAIIRRFDEAFSPSSLLATSTPKSSIYNFSFGSPLLDYPLVRTAHLLLNLNRGKISLEDAGVLLRSPFVGEGDQEQVARGELDRKLRQQGEVRFSLKRLQNLSRAFCPLFSERIGSLIHLSDSFPKRALPGEWVGFFKQFLECSGWPGERSMNSEEFQTVEAWQAVLSNFSKLDRIDSSMDQHSALKKLFQFSAETLFQPQTEKVPIQILGPLEAAGEQFDALWLMGCHDGIWPPPARPNPFIPIPIQRKHAVPHSTALREHEYTKLLTSRLFASAKEVRVSYPQLDGDEALRPSPFLKGLRESCFHKSEEGLFDRLPGQAEIENIDDRFGIPLSDNGKVAGGVGIFKAQSACPFQAYARYRLAARQLDEAEEGLNALERGSLVHAILEKFWRELKTEKTMRSMSDERKSKVIRKVVCEALEAFMHRNSILYSEGFKANEQARHEALLFDWLKEEEKRAEFVKTEVEVPLDIQVGRLKMEVKIDRIDHYPDGSVAVVDYKTGRCSPNDWLEERPDEPQLPLYGLYSGETCSSLLFGQVKKGEMGFKGIGSQPETGIKMNLLSAEEWDAQQQLWREAVDTLAAEISAGLASVTPKDRQSSCRYCDLGAFCRVREEELNG